MARAGADVILCQHSHCIGCYENYGGSHILYGQGNFHFVNPVWSSDMWNTMLAVTYDTVSHAIDFIPVVAEGLGITLAKGSERDRLLAEFAARNASLLDGTWKQEWHDFCLSKEESYKKVIANACNEEATQRQQDVFGQIGRASCRERVSSVV